MKYASVYERARSPKLSISYWNPKKQKRVHETTPFNKDDPQGRRKALTLANEKGKLAKADKSVGTRERWESWVTVFLDARYKNSPKTLRRMTGAWEQWALFLHNEQIRVPIALDYNAVLRFVEWRSNQVKRPSGKQVSKNTALCDVKVMSVIMREAMHRGYAVNNPCEKLGIRKDPAKVKPEITDAEVAVILGELKTRPEWMQVSFQIALHQGCRLSETAVPLQDVDLERRTITFAAKGRGDGIKHIFTTKLHDGLRPLFSELLRARKKLACELPEMAAKEWHSFFQEVGLPHLCFHCTRVTVITKMARAGVPISQAMAFVGHASETIHRIYQRLAAQDLSGAVSAISYSSPTPPHSPSPSANDG